MIEKGRGDDGVVVEAEFPVIGNLIEEAIDWIRLRRPPRNQVR